MSSKYNIKIAPGAIVCNECELKGDITIGTKTVIHPKAKIIAESGPIIIGKVFLSVNLLLAFVVKFSSPFRHNLCIIFFGFCEYNPQKWIY